jgi:hypothetical protein
LKLKLDFKVKALQINHGNSTIQSIIIQLYTFKYLKERKIEGMLVRSRLKWKQKRDAITRYLQAQMDHFQPNL